ncbi:type VI secretion system accessory protein TagJ [Azospirillum picis]|uniref:Type VI secretion system protein ImpE n=1 Tax=Azospirillum picis TaxID=488438 RepID=A0ABU0MFK9_9PROT|nr:type VI secretion system accessory protein TagJ [Azospirillum picis]MBP2298728.1 type VI secretion system protein ImpE [Azospirillum picis]MDQ0532223.1 type VI secretion system protein ImpE [Azospirillum picis]
MSETAAELFQSGRLDEAIAALNGEIKKKPTDLDRRVFLAELLSFSGNLDRADLQLDTLGTQEPQIAVTMALFRQLVRADQARRQLFADGRVPEFIDLPPPDHLRLHLEAVTALRAGDVADAAAKLAQAESLRPPVAGRHDGASFDDFRDLDDLTGGFFEVYTSTGKYFWIATETVELIEFRAPERPRDLLWRPAHMVVRGGPDGEVYLPAIYAGAPADAADAVKLGRVTEWSEDADAPVRGTGQRCFLVGDECVPMMQLGTLEFSGAV